MTAETQVAKQVAEVSEIQVDEKCGSDTTSYQDPTKHHGINNVGGNAGPADPDPSDGAIDNSYVSVSSSSNGVSDDPADKVFPVEESMVSLESITASQNGVDSGELNISYGDVVDHSLPESNCIVQESEAVPVNNVDSLRKDEEEEARVVMTADSAKQNGTIVGIAAAQPEQVRDEIESGSSFRPPENDQSLPPTTDSVDLPNGIIVPNTDTMPQQLEVSLEPTQDKVSEVMVLKANTESADSEETASLLPSIDDAVDENKETKVANLQTSDVIPRGQDSHLLVSEVVAESQVTEQSNSAPPGTNLTGDENKEIKESNVEALDDSSQGQDSEFRVLKVNVESREETEIVSPDIMESRDDNKGIDEIRGSQIVVLNMDVDSRDRGEMNVLSPDVKETGDDSKESEGDVLGTSHPFAEAQESQNVVAENAEYQLAEIESAKTTLEEKKDFQLSNEFLEEHESQNVALGTSVSRPVEVALDGNSEEGNSSYSTDDLGDKHKPENVILKASGCQSGELDFGLNEESVELCNSRQVAVKNPESVSKEAEVQILNSEQQCEIESLQQVHEGGSLQVPGAVSLDSGSCLPDDGGVDKLDQEGKTVLCPNQKEIHVSDTAFNQHVQVDLEAKSYSVNETDTALEADNAIDSILDENKNELDVPHMSECAQQTHAHNGSLGDGEKPIEMNEASVSDHSLARAHSMRAEAESNGKPIESDENAPSGSRDVTTVHHETKLEVSTPSDAKYTEDAMPCSVGNIKVDPTKSEKVVANGSIDGHSISSYPVNDEALGTESTLKNVDLGDKDCSSRGEDVHSKTKDLSGDVESLDGHSVSADVKLDSQVEDSCTLGSRDKLSNDVIATGSVVLDSSDVNKEGASKEVVEIVDVENASDKFNDVDRNGECNLIFHESGDTEESQITEVAASMPKSSSADAMAGQELGVEVMMRPFNFLMKIPRFDDEKLRERIRHAQLQVEEKTKHRDSFRLEIQKKKANLQAYGAEFEAAIAEEREARRLVKKKRIEIESLQSLLNRVKNAISVDEIDTQIHKMEHMIQHETLPLKEEKQIIREMKRLNQLREQLSSNIGTEDEIEEARDQRDQIEDRLKALKKELDSLKNKVLKAEAVATTARRKYDDENKKFKELQNQFKAADDIRQAAYSQLLSLRRELFEKNKQFRVYKNDAAAASDYALNRNREALHRHCVNQVETIMELWNNSGDFRKEYVRCNLRSTLRRLGTLEGRSLGPDEKPPVLPSYVEERVDRVKFGPEKASSVLETAVEQKAEVICVGGVVEGKSTAEVAEPVKQTVKVREPTKSTSANSLPSSCAKSMSKDNEEERLQTKEELELARKAEELRKEEEAATLKEQRRLEEMAKAKEALERKRRIAEKAQMRAELRAQKEAEQKEKEREKRLRKKERKKAVEAEAHEGNGNGESAQSSESSMETAKDSEMKEIPTTTTTTAKRPQKTSHFAKQSKSKSIPPPLRNRSRRKMQQWMWVIFTSIVVVGLFFLGNIGVFSNLRPRKSAW